MPDESDPDEDLEQIASPILGGTAATQDQIYSTVAILEIKNGSLRCTGTLIAPTVVVTAAHCLIRLDPTTGQFLGEVAPAEIIVAAGALDALSATLDQQYDVVKLVPHIGYNGLVSSNMDGLGNRSDIGLVVLQQSITSLPSAPVLPLAQLDSNLSKGVAVTIEGYGARDPVDMTRGQLYLAETPYQERSETEFIAGIKGSPDACPGDSGGPVYLSVGSTRYVVGAIARQVPPKETACGNGTISTIIASHEAWLREHSGGAYPPASDGGSSGSGDGAGVPGCSCKVGYAPTPSGPGLWIGLGIALLAAKRLRRSRSSRHSH